MTEPAPPPPPEAQSAPPAPTTTASGGGGLNVGPGLIVALIGAVIVVVSIFLNWVDISDAGRSLSGSADTVPVQFLVDKGTSSEDPSIIVLLAPAAALLAVGAFLRTRIVGILGGVLAIIVPVLYAIQVQRGLDEGNGALDIGLTDFIGIGVYVALVGGIVGLVGALLPRKS